MGSSINTLANSGYYQLANMTGGQSGNTSAGNTSPQATNTTQSLLQALEGTSSSTGASSNAAYTLSLSPAAQQYLNSVGSTSTPSLSSFLSGTGSATSASATSAGSSGSESFTLTSQQQQAITNILKKYENAPYTQATFDKIQNDLNAAGLGTNTLSSEDQASSFNPTMLLVNDLNGGAASGNSGMASASEEQTKSTNYMNAIISQWKALSGNAGTSTTSTASTSNNNSSGPAGTQTASAVSGVSSGGGA